MVFFSWKSTHQMVEKAVEARIGLDSLTADELDLQTLAITEEEWSQIKEVLEFLEPFALVANEMERAVQPTLYIVLPLYNQLIDHVTEWIGSEDAQEGSGNHLKETVEAARAAKEKLAQYETKTTTYLIPIVLDPRLKMDYFKNDQWGDLAETMVLPA